MGKTWVLHTETKGTGAHMVPLERAADRPSAVKPEFVRRKPRAPEPAVPDPGPPRTFRIVDVMTRQTVADGVSAREAVDVLKDVRSIVDVDLYVWVQERGRWLPVSLADQRAMISLAHEAGSCGPDAQTVTARSG